MKKQGHTFLSSSLSGINPRREKQFSVGYTPWESSVIAPGWKALMDEQDAIWTPSQYCREVFKNYDIDATVVPHGIDPEVYSINERTLNSPFIFLHIGSPTERKGSQLVVDAFVDLFEGNEDVQLILKSSGPTNARWRDRRGVFHGNANNHPQIHALESQIDVVDMAKLYHRSHCFVYPSNGEGFGMIPFQAIATGMPTIVTDATAMSDFAHWGFPLKSKPTAGYGIHLGEWAEPDRDHLRELMQYVVDNWAEENKRAIQNARILHAQQTWDHVAKQIIGLLGDHL